MTAFTARKRMDGMYLSAYIDLSWPRVPLNVTRHCGLDALSGFPSRNLWRNAAYLSTDSCGCVRNHTRWSKSTPFGGESVVSSKTLSRRSKPEKVEGLSKPPARPRRRTQAERSADTRSRLIQAAITCLYRTGYSATTISTVADEAGVSRGAMTHQFPAKTDLMLAVVQAVFKDDAKLYNAAVASMTPRQWLQSFSQTMWGIISRPSGIAVMEIMLASRSDPDLAKKLRVLQTEIDKLAYQWSAERVEAAQMPVHPDADAIHEVYVAAVRGLALRATFMDNDVGVQKSLKILSEMRRLLYHNLKS